MPQFPDLPSELLLQIFEDVEPERLIQYCYVSRRIRDVAQPCLYEWIIFNGSQYLLLERLWSFTRTMLGRPDLAPRVKRMTIDLSGTAGVLQLDERLEDLQLFHTALPGLDPSSKSTTVGYAQLLAVLSVRLPALEYLKLHIEKSFPEDLSYLLQQARDISPSAIFPALKVLMLKGYDGYFSLSDALPLLVLPTLRTVVASMFLASYGPDFPSTSLDNLTVIHATSVELLNCSIEERNFQNLIKACRNLKVLKYASAQFSAFQINHHHGPMHRLLTPHRFVQALSPRSDTLVRLSLTYYPPDGTTNNSSATELATLKQFHQLKFISIQIDLWAALRDKLPANLVAVELTVSSQRYDVERDFFRHLFMAKDLWMPGIKIISLQRTAAVDAAKLIKQHAREQHTSGYTIWHETEYGYRRDAVELPIDSGFVVELTHRIATSVVAIHSRTLGALLGGDGELGREALGHGLEGGTGWSRPSEIDQATKLPILQCRCTQAEDLLA
ncbi:hypothetical protein BDV96DRAFT_583121 [Lophiotrema nucula]|uniref:F-box domain-containing protein n=1 Tax=Lophiotrema nucula TaxID=690887 RepID=A0A6A5YV87_9PLEO|nr:hypothetical protein BDV96DRAFT_583121 [Lophiotrema nucula]